MSAAKPVKKPAPKQSAAKGRKADVDSATRPRPSATRPTATRSSSSRPPAGKKNRRPPAPAIIVGAVSPLTRPAGAVAALAAVLAVVGTALPLARTTGPLSPSSESVGGAANLWDFAAVLPLVAVLLYGAWSCVRPTLPRLGLGLLAAAGAVAVGTALHLLFLLAGGELSFDLAVPEAQFRVFQYAPAAGLWLRLAAALLTVVAAGLALAAWRRTEMDDDGSLDPKRPLLGGLALVVGLVALAGALLAPAVANGPAGLSFDPEQRAELSQLGFTLSSPDLPLASYNAAAQALFERPGFEVLAGLALAVLTALAAVLAPSLRPRLAAVGVFAGLAGALGATALAQSLLVVRSTALGLGTGTLLLLVAAACFALLAVLSARVGRTLRP